MWHSHWFCTFGDTKVGPIGRWFHELRRDSVGESFPKVVVIGQHEIQSKLFRLCQDPTITRFRMIPPELHGSGLNSGEVANRIIKE